MGIGIEPGPRLDHRVDVKGIEILGELHQIDRGGIDRQIDDHAAARPCGEQRGEHVAVVFLGDCLVDETQLALVEQMAIRALRRDHGEFLPIEGEVALKERQRAFADRAEADHHDRAVEPRMQRPSGLGFGHRMHGCSFSRLDAATPCVARRAQI